MKSNVIRCRSRIRIPESETARYDFRSTSQAGPRSRGNDSRGIGTRRQSQLIRRGEDGSTAHRSGMVHGLPSRQGARRQSLRVRATSGRIVITGHVSCIAIDQSETASEEVSSAAQAAIVDAAYKELQRRKHPEPPEPEPHAKKRGRSLSSIAPALADASIVLTLPLRCVHGSSRRQPREECSRGGVT